MVIDGHVDSQLRAARKHQLIALENELVGDGTLVHQVDTDTGEDRIPVITGLLWFGEVNTREADGADALGEGEIRDGRHALRIEGT